MEKKSNKSPFLVEGWHFPGKENKQLGPVRGRVSVCSVYNERSLARPQHAILDVTVSLSEWVPGLRTCSWSPLHPLPPPSPPPPPRCWPSMWSPACSPSSSWFSSWPSWTSWRCLCPSWWWRCWAAPAAGWGRPPSSPSAPPTMRTSRGRPSERLCSPPLWCHSAGRGTSGYSDRPHGDKCPGRSCPGTPPTLTSSSRSQPSQSSPPPTCSPSPSSPGRRSACWASQSSPVFHHNVIIM